MPSAPAADVPQWRDLRGPTRIPTPLPGPRLRSRWAGHSFLRPAGASRLPSAPKDTRAPAPGPAPPAGGVVLLPEDPNLPTATSAYLNTLTPSTSATYVVGGPAATALDRSLPGWPNVTRLVGVDRFDTAARVATSALFSNGAS